MKCSICKTKLQPGEHSWCRTCRNAKSRAYYRQRQASGSCAAHVPPHLLPKVKPGETITCLRCRHCRLEPDTDFTSSLPMVFCEKTSVRRPVNLSGCDVADPRPGKPKHLHSYWAKYGPLGDKVRGATEPLLAYLRARWANGNATKLEQHTGRSIADLSALVRYHGIGGVLTRNHRVRRAGGHRVQFTQRQRDWLMSEYLSDRWPRPAIPKLPADELARRHASQQALVEHVATLGPRWSWRQVQHFVHKEARRRRDRKAAAKRGDVRLVNKTHAVPMHQLV